MAIRNGKARSKGRTELGLALERGAREILAHVKGGAILRTRRIVLPDEVDVKRIRTRARISQAEFARAFCINPRTLQEWGARAQKTRRHHARLSGGNREEPGSGVGRTGLLILWGTGAGSSTIVADG